MTEELTVERAYWGLIVSEGESRTTMVGNTVAGRQTWHWNKCSVELTFDPQV